MYSIKVLADKIRFAGLYRHFADNKLLTKRFKSLFLCVLVACMGVTMIYIEETIWLWIPTCCWMIWRYSLRYMLPGSFLCIQCARMKCRKHTGGILESGTICSECLNKRNHATNTISEMNEALQSIREGVRLLKSSSDYPQSTVILPPDEEHRND
jgi:hypothetical protein